MLLPDLGDAERIALIANKQERRDAFADAMRGTHDSPLPGDLIIREEEERTGVRPLAVFVVAVWPQTERSAGPYLSYGYAHRQARQLASQRKVRVWREHAQGLHDVSDD